MVALPFGLSMRMNGTRRPARFKRLKRIEPTAEEAAAIAARRENVAGIRRLAKKLDLIQAKYRAQLAVCIAAQRQAWPKNPARLQRLLELLWEADEVRREAQAL